MRISRVQAPDVGEVFAEAVSIMHRLRAPGGCPWDREQTFETIQPHTLEEAYELFDAISRGDWENLREELGDLLLQILFYSEIAEEAGYFSAADVVESLNRKLVRRHPHVFPPAARDLPAGLSPGETHAGIDAAQVVRNWDAIKEEEKGELNAKVPAGTKTRQSRLDSIPRALPALVEARKLGSGAGKVGFDWPDAGGIFEKIVEETGELQEAIGRERAVGAAGGEVAAEMGDLLFTMANLARRLGVDPEMALREANGKFRRRFGFMEDAAARSGLPLDRRTPDDLESLWRDAKKTESREKTSR